MEFETKRLLIKKFIPEYIGIMYDNWACDREVLRYIPEFKDKSTIDEFADIIMRGYKDNRTTYMLIQEKNYHKIIGFIYLYQEDSRSKSINIILNKDEWNKGYGLETLKELIKVLKKQHIECLYATSDERNIAATRICEKAKFELIDKIDNYREDIDHILGSECLYELEL